MTCFGIRPLITLIATAKSSLDAAAATASISSPSRPLHSPDPAQTIGLRPSEQVTEQLFNLSLLHLMAWGPMNAAPGIHSDLSLEGPSSGPDAFITVRCGVSTLPCS